MAAALVASSAFPLGDECTAELVPDPYPTRTMQTVFGPYGSSYVQTSLVTPEPVPVVITQTDDDLMLAICAGNCVATEIAGEGSVEWTISGQNGGKFVDPNARTTALYKDSSCALYLPPSDLVVGETRITTFEARVFDTCTIAKDPDSFVSFQCMTTRTSKQSYDVTVTVVTSVTPYLYPPDCDNGSASGKKGEIGCELLGPTHQPLSGVSVAITDYPNPGIYLGERRLLRCTASDLDRDFMECGIPKSNPPCSNFTFTEHCDDLTYDWSVVAGPGNGIFSFEDRGTFFEATAEGNVTVQVTATASDGENASTQVTFAVAKVQVKELAFANAKQLLQDTTGAIYSAPHWRDTNGNGNANQVGERRFPVSYVRGTQVQLQSVLLAIQAGLDPMPGEWLEGISPQTGERFVAPVVKEAGTGNWGGFEFVTTGNLPAVVRKFDPYTIDWTYRAGQTQVLPINSTQHPIYVTLAAPLTPYGAYESMFDIACRNADGKNDVVVCLIDTWVDFADRNLVRRSVDGFNAPNGDRLTYWQANNFANNTAGLLLANKDGTCGGWAQLLRGCFGVHGQATQRIDARAAAPGVNSGIIVKNATAPVVTPLFLSNVTLQGSIPGQGPNPPIHQWFDGHSVLEVNVLGTTFLLDPSYGVLHPLPGQIDARNSFENSSLFGLVPNFTTPPTSVVVRKVLNTLQLTYVPGL